MKEIVIFLLILFLLGCDNNEPNGLSNTQDVVSSKQSIYPEVLPVNDLSHALENDIVINDLNAGWVGVVIPNNSVDVVANTGGLLKITARIGSSIRQGDVLARVDNFSAEDDLKIEEFKLDALKAELEQATFKAEQELALYNRRVNYVDAISKDELDRSESSAREAEARAKVTQSNLEEQLLRVEQFKQRILSQSIGSPLSGTVVSHYLDSGSVVGAGEAIMRISTDNTFTIRFAIEPSQANLLNIGSQVKLIIGAIEIPAEVMGVAPFVDVPSQKVFVEAFPLEQNKILKTGLGVVVVPADSGRLELGQL